MRDVFIQPSGQDDNLGDSALRAGLVDALRAPDVRLHINLEGQSADYVAGIPIEAGDAFYSSRSSWLDACVRAIRPVYVLNAGEINPARGGRFPHPDRVAEMRAVTKRRGIVIAAGVGLKDPSVAGSVQFHSTLRHAAVMSWRDRGSRDAAGFGDVAPDWAFALGAPTTSWQDVAHRKFIAVTLRFDRALPPAAWFDDVRALAAASGTQLVTVAQVARDAPRAVELAAALGGRYLVSPTTRHDELDRHVRSVYALSLAVVSDRAHALIMGATEGAYPIGSAADPQKIYRILDVAQLASLTGDNDGLRDRAAGLETKTPALMDAVDSARKAVSALGGQIRQATSVAD